MKLPYQQLRSSIRTSDQIQKGVSMIDQIGKAIVPVGRTASRWALFGSMVSVDAVLIFMAAYGYYSPPALPVMLESAAALAALSQGWWLSSSKLNAFR